MKVKVLVVAIVGLLSLGLGYILLREWRERTAIQTLRDWSKSTEEQRTAAQLLTQSSDPSTTEQLVSILMEPGTRQDIRVIVIQILSQRQQPEVSTGLSRTIRPQNPIVLRIAAVNALYDRTCDDTCVDEILHYMERVWAGEVPSELATPQASSSADEFRKQESEVDAGLVHILLNNRASTLEQLRQIYGLGSMHPSKFAIHMVQVLNLGEACRDLGRQYLVEASRLEIQEAIRETVQKLKCNSTN